MAHRKRTLFDFGVKSATPAGRDSEGKNELPNTSSEVSHVESPSERNTKAPESAVTNVAVSERGNVSEDSAGTETMKFNKNEAPAMESSGRKYYFQESWLTEFPWTKLEAGKLFCTTCRKAMELKIFTSAITIQHAFISLGFTNWKNAASRLKKHEQSEQHIHAISGLQKPVTRPVSQQISEQKVRSQRRARKALTTIITSMQFLAKQGLAIRGHNKDDGNFLNLLKLRSGDVEELNEWLQRSKPLTSSDVQNEIISLLAHSVLRELLSKVKKAGLFSIMVDESSDTAGKEQLSFCVRIVSEDLEPEELFLGLYEVTSTTADNLKAVVMDILTRFELKVTNLRGQCFDGAKNMSGIYRGLATQISAAEPRAIYVHCYCHCLNLAVKDSVQGILQLRNTMGTIHELAVVVKSSPKRLARFMQICEDVDGNTSLRPQPLCPTRFLLRVRSFKAVKENYAVLLQLMEEIGLSSDACAAKAYGIYHQLQNPETYFRVLLCLELFDNLEALSTALQASDISVSAALEAVRKVELVLSARTTHSEGFDEMWKNTLKAVSEHHLQEPRLPRQRKVP